MNATVDIFDAVKQNDLDRLALLLRDDPSLAAARDESGISVLLIACYYRRSDAVASLRALRSDLDIFEASAVSDTARVRALLDADPSIVNGYTPDGYFPLGYAAFFADLDIVNLLLGRGADVHAVSRNAMRVQALHSALAAGQDAIARSLIEHGADVNAKQQDSYTPLHEAAGNGNVAMVELLLAHGADRTARLDDGRTPAEVAAAAGHTAIVERLRVPPS